MGALTYAVLKTIFSLMTDRNVVSNPEFFILIHTSSHIFVIKISVNLPFFAHLALLDLKLKHHLMTKFLSSGPEKKCLKV